MLPPVVVVPAEVGASVGAEVGAEVGADVAADEGAEVGADVGAEVGASVAVSVLTTIGVEVSPVTGTDWVGFAAGAHAAITKANANTTPRNVTLLISLSLS